MVSYSEVILSLYSFGLSNFNDVQDYAEFFFTTVNSTTSEAESKMPYSMSKAIPCFLVALNRDSGITTNEANMAMANEAPRTSTIAEYVIEIGWKPFPANKTEKGMPMPRRRLKSGPPKQAEYPILRKEKTTSD